MSVWGRWKRVVDGWARHHRELPRPWQLYRKSWGDYRANLRSIVWLLTIVALPVAIISSTVTSATSDTATGAWLSLLQIIMNVALIYMVVRVVAGKPVTVRDAYYDGSAVLVRFLLLAAVLVALLIPVLLGAVILGAGLQTIGTALAPQEQALVVVLAVLVAIPGVVMLIRGGWGVFVLFESKLGPIEALKQSRALTRGRVVVLLGRVMAVVVLLLLTVLAPAIVLGVLSYVTHWVIFDILLQYLITIIVLPLATFALYHLYRGMQ